MFGIGWVELHDATTVRSSLLVVSSGKLESLRNVTVALVDNLDDDSHFSCLCCFYG
jgi:hypothetical protein